MVGIVTSKPSLVESLTSLSAPTPPTRAYIVSRKPHGILACGTIFPLWHVAKIEEARIQLIQPSTFMNHDGCWLWLGYGLRHKCNVTMTHGSMTGYSGSLLFVLVNQVNV